jgi:hypothetical protein
MAQKSFSASLADLKGCSFDQAAKLAFGGELEHD